MGNIFSFCCSINKQEEQSQPLITTYRCFVCGVTFSSNNSYNKHIVRCSPFLKRHV